MPTVEQLITKLNLKPLPEEGGYYNEHYRSAGVIPHVERNYSTSIYFMLPAGQISALHRIKSDEGWHFYLGGPMTVVQISPEGKVEKIVLGQDVLNGQKVQHVVPAGYWFGAYPNPGTEYALVGCTVAPGFDFADFELGTRADLLRQFPQAEDVISQLTHP